MGRRTNGLVCVLGVLVAAVALLPAAAGASRLREDASLDSGVLVGLNQIRVANGLVPLEPSKELAASARQHSRDMAENGYFGHSSSNGTPFWKRIEGFYMKSQYNHYGMVGENLLQSSEPLDAAAALAAWMASPDHRANILYPSWRDIGVSAVIVAPAAGAAPGGGTTLITTDFGFLR